MKIKGFTIIEMLVSLSVFMVAIAISSNIFISSLKVQKRSLTNQQIISQTSYALNYMTRALRMAKKDEEGDCISKKLNYEKTSNRISFKNYKEECQEFFLENGQIKEKRDETTLPLTFTNLEIVDFNIALSGERQGSGDDLENYQPRITLFLRVKGKDRPEIKKFQTTISQRNLDIYK